MLIVRRQRNCRDACLLDDVASGIAHGLVEQETEPVSTGEQPSATEPSFLENLAALLGGGVGAAGAMARQAIANNPAVAGATAIGEALGAIVPPIVEIARRIRVPTQVQTPTWPNRPPPPRVAIPDQTDPILQPTPDYNDTPPQ